MVGVAGIALIGGRLLAGFLLDRIHGPYVAAAFVLATMAGILRHSLLAQQPPTTPPCLVGLLPPQNVLFVGGEPKVACEFTPSRHWVCPGKQPLRPQVSIYFYNTFTKEPVEFKK